MYTEFFYGTIFFISLIIRVISLIYRFSMDCPTKINDLNFGLFKVLAVIVNVPSTVK